MYHSPAAAKRNPGIDVQVYRVPLRYTQARNANRGPFVLIHYYFFVFCFCI